jgi:ABC-type nitrate/sulfonate/bicarbonate transport system substrate-binding protein
MAVFSILISACAGAGSPSAAGGSPGASAGSAEPSIQASASTAAGPRPKVIVGTGSDSTYSPFIVAVEKGFFDKYGIDGEYNVFDAGNLTIEAVGAGTIQVGGAGELTGMTFLSKGSPVTYVATHAQTGESGGGCAGPGITSPEGLRGKKAGTQIGSTTHLYAALFLDHYGLTDDVELVNINQPDMIAAMARGDIQAFFSVEPWMTRAAEEVPGVTCPWRYNTDDIYELNIGLYMNREWIDANPELAKNTLRAMLDAVDWVRDNYDETAQIVSDPLRTPPEFLVVKIFVLV